MSATVMPRSAMAARARCTSRSLRLNQTQIGSSWTMVASWFGWSPPTSSPTETLRAVTTPSNGAETVV